MGNKMLIDATHPEETRVVVTRGNRVEEFDYESATRKQLRGNIYLAKIARIEPSLQAAFVNYGGNRHGFLAFAEIHPDYYQIPVAVREAMMKEDALDRQHHVANGDSGQSAEAEQSADASYEVHDEPADTAHSSESGESSEVEAVTAEVTGETPSPEARGANTRRKRPRSRRSRLYRPSRQAEDRAKLRYRSKRRCRPSFTRNSPPPWPAPKRHATKSRRIPTTLKPLRSGERPRPLPLKKALTRLPPRTGELAEPASASSETSGDDGEQEHEHWERHKRAHSEGGGVISVPEAATPGSCRGHRLRGRAGRTAAAA